MRALTRAFIVFSILFAFACDRENPAPPDGGGNPQRDAGTVDATVPDAGPTTCQPRSSECWDETPTTSTQLLNACTDSTCVPFDNCARLPLLRPDGTLPPLP